jgi:predicted flap endonuclease-1-like 5' DNA nuclease
MSKNPRKGTATWLLSLFTLLAVVNLINAVIQVNFNGADSPIVFRVFGLWVGGPVNAEVYLFESLIVTLFLFGVTSYSVYRGVPVDPHVLQRIGKVEENLATNSNMIENTQIGFFRKLEENQNANDELYKRINVGFDNMKKEASDNLTQQKAALEKMEEENKRYTEAMNRQAKELTRLKKRIEQLAMEPAQRPKLTSHTKLEQVKSIPPKLATKLNQMQTTNVSDLLAADAVILAQRASEMVETIANVQAKAQLLMVPGISEENAEMLVKHGIMSRKELANQDTVQLYRGIVGIAKSYVDQGKLPPNKVPAVEDVSSWIKQAQL